MVLQIPGVVDLVTAQRHILGPTPAWTAFLEHQAQIEFYTCAKRFIVCEAGRRSGKTHLVKCKGEREGLGNVERDDYRAVFAAPTRDQAKRIYWDAINALTPRKIVTRRRESKLELSICNGTTFQVVGMDKPQRIEGAPVDWIACDEFAEWKQDAYDINVRPLLSTPGRPGKAIFFGVPRPSLQFRTMSEIARDPKNAAEWAYFWWDAESIADAKEIASAKATMDPLLYEQEYGGRRVSLAGRVYYTFDRALHASDVLEYDPNLPLIFCFDFNTKPGVAAVLQEQVYRGLRKDIGTKFIAVIGEVWIPDGSNTPDVCRRLIADWGPNGTRAKHAGKIECYGDISGASHQTSQTKLGTDWEIIRSMLTMPDAFPGRVSIYVKGHPAERDRVNAVCSILKNAAGVVRMLICPKRAPHVCDDFEMVTIRRGTDGEIDKDRDKSLTHLSDGIGYFVEYRFPITGGASVMRQIG